MIQGDETQAGPSRSRPTSPAQFDSGRTSTSGYRHVLESTKATEMEMHLRRAVREEGEIRHELTDGEVKGKEIPVLELGAENDLGQRSRSKEKTIVVDLGNGPEDVILIDWAEGDPEVCVHVRLKNKADVQNPFNYTLLRKSVILFTACLITLLTAINCTSTAIISNWGIDYFGVSREQFLVSQTVLMVTIAFTPMLLAPISEAVSLDSPSDIVAC
jgi:hypothetical protein